MWGRFHDASDLDLAAREAVPTEIVSAYLGHWCAGLTLAKGTDSNSVFVALSKGKAPDGPLAAVVSAALLALHCEGADLFAVWICREANKWADALAGARDVAAAMGVSAAWHRRVRERCAGV